MNGPPRFPGSTYRLQLHPGFTFADAAAIVPYLATLGITDCYISPPFTARPGSSHGYDVVNHNELNPELGGEAGFTALTDAIGRHSMGLLVDFVPNHMGNDPQTNEWWRDVLENGPSSPWARCFDIDWDPIKPELKDRLLLPILGEQYGEALESGKLRLKFEDGALSLDYLGHRLPINPRRSPIVFESRIEELSARLGADHPGLREFLSILTALKNLPPYTERDAHRIVERQREKVVARERLARLVATSPEVRAYVDAAVTAFNGTPGDPASMDRLHELLELQAYRLASWRTAADEINYRRFFDVNELAGLRVEDPEVFREIHRLVLRLVAEDRITGLRLDHIDGLLDPADYFSRLHEAIGRPFYVVVEKILARHERLPRDWAVAGTTGYDFLNEVNGLFVDGSHERSLSRAFVRLTGREDQIADVEYESKRLIIGTALSSEFQVLTAALNRLSERGRRFRDFTYGSIRRALREVIACYPVYRTYVSPRGVGMSDRAAVDHAIAAARLRNPALEPSIFEFLRSVLLPEPGVAGEPVGTGHGQRLAAAMKVQQYTAPLQAKGIEDTAFYRYGVLLSLNEVGGDPGEFGTTAAAFHRANERRQADWPHAMNATATHDTKRGEDGRARLNVLTELPSEWREEAVGWMRMNRGLRTTVDGQPSPDRGDEYQYYQALLAAWPAEPRSAPVPTQAPEEFVARLRGYMSKAIREAKLHTSWINPNEGYELAVDHFVERTLTGEGAARFLAAFVPFARRIAAAGMVNSLAQLVLKLVSPGVPDFYQGVELWDLSLVDPDNRRPVDYDERRRLLAAMEPLLDRTSALASPDPAEVDGELASLLDEWSDGRIKLFVTAAGLRFRQSRRELFANGAYVEVPTEGERSEHVVACGREHEGEVVLAVAPRLATSAGFATDGWTAQAHHWRDTRLRLPERWHHLHFRSVLTGKPVPAIRTSHGAWMLAPALLDVWPVALLWAPRA